MATNIEESLTDLPSRNLSETRILEVRKSHLLLEDICKVIGDITNTLETVHCDLEELKRKVTEKFQETLKTIKN